ncbi:hemoglobin subunit alpha-1-like [Polyodon spathula]|uniref:hemoglobin subunit alpha-1-like n=1 Tax=Polyodon spathula TaxID=7913 RepID=UPI001B7F697A|nr:hemoglobin subunit alpha-1-like [Polyodon spathula]
MGILTQDDKQNIRDVWAKISEKPEDNGKAIIIRLFVDHPETKKYFDHFKNVKTREELEVMPRVKVHGKRVMNALNQIVENMDDWGAVVGILTPMVERHKDVHKVGVHNFKLLFETIINVYQDALGASFTPPICESWNKVFNLFFDFMEAFYTNTSES